MSDTEVNTPRRRVWPTKFCPLPMHESNLALEHASTTGLAIYAALHKLRFLAPEANRAAFYCSEAQIARYSGMSPRRIREPLRALEAAGLVRIARPVGLDRVRHQAAKISLLPVFVDGNKIRDKESVGTPARQDETSAPDGTKRPVRTGQKRARKCPTLQSPPYYVRGDTVAAEAGGAVRAPAGGTVSEEKPTEQEDRNAW